jgi:hypothetical protein
LTAIKAPAAKGCNTAMKIADSEEDIISHDIYHFLDG